MDQEKKNLNHHLNQKALIAPIITLDTQTTDIGSSGL